MDLVQCKVQSPPTFDWAQYIMHQRNKHDGDAVKICHSFGSMAHPSQSASKDPKPSYEHSSMLIYAPAHCPIRESDLDALR
jgi:hypothetical protein